jgi:drug/metabolite transporter (DMT)-like permease
MGRRNWLVTIAGVFVFFLGFVLMAFVGKNHHGLLGFLAPFSLVSGLVLCVVGMVLPAGASTAGASR